MRVVLAGGSGLIGRHLAKTLVERGDRIEVLSRDPRRAARVLPPDARLVRWEPPHRCSDLSRVLAGTDAVINLAGSSVGAWPWTPGRKRRLVDSRLDATHAIVEAFRRIPPERRPRVLLSMSGTDAYEGRDRTPATEVTEPGDTFLARLCAAWEEAACAAEPLGVRVVRLRSSMVIARDAPALLRFALPVRLMVGRVGSGRQWVSWIHHDDAVALILMLLDRDDVSGPVNACAPDPRRQAELAQAIGNVLGRPLLLRVPGWAVRLALGEQATLVLGSRRVWPARALALGYGFRHPKLEGALQAELS